MTHRQLTRYTSILVVVVIVVAGAWRIWWRYENLPASDSQRQDVEALVEKHPELRPSYDRALADGVLTVREAKLIRLESESLGKK